MWRSSVHRAFVGVIFASFHLGIVTFPATAGDWAPRAEPAAKLTYYEGWAGADVASGNWSVYGGMAAALSGDIREDGWRVRSSTGYGRYRYQRPAFDAANRRVVWPEFRGQMTFADALIGYQRTFGPTVVKAYGGIAEESHDVRPGAGSILAIDDENAVQGSRYGFKGVLETWTSLGDWGFVQADVNWSQPFQAYGGRLRTRLAVQSQLVDRSRGGRVRQYQSRPRAGGRIPALRVGRRRNLSLGRLRRRPERYRRPLRIAECDAAVLTFRARAAWQRLAQLSGPAQKRSGPAVTCQPRSPIWSSSHCCRCPGGKTPRPWIRPPRRDSAARIAGCRRGGSSSSRPRYRSGTASGSARDHAVGIGDFDDDFLARLQIGETGDVDDLACP